MRDLIFDLAFPKNYEVQEAELPGDGKAVIYQPGGSSTQGKDGILLRFRPHRAAEWVGCFAFGHYSHLIFSGVFATPNPDYVCIVSHAKAYWVNASDPGDCRVLQFLPVLSTRILAEQNALLLTDFTSLALVGGDGVVWRSPRLCWDELRVLSIENGMVSGKGYDPTSMGESDFSFDLRTRKVLRSGYPAQLGSL